MRDLFRRTIRYEAVLQLTEKKFTELNRATVVITDNDDDDVLIGVKALYRKFQSAEDRTFASMDQVGDYCKVSKACTVGEFFDSLEQMLVNVANMVERAENGEYSQEQNDKELCDKA